MVSAVPTACGGTDSVTSTEVVSGTMLQDNRSANRSFVNTQLRLEIKL